MKRVRQRNRSVFGKAKTGFSLIEIIVAIAIIGVMAAIIVPRLRVRGGKEIDVMVDSIAALTSSGYERALMTGKVHRVFFMMKEPAHVELQIAQDTKASDTELKFTKAPADYNTVSFAWDLERFDIKNFYIKGSDEAARGNLKDAWFYILPDGLSQEIVINIHDRQTGDERGLILNPFHVKFAVYDTFQKP